MYSEESVLAITNRYFPFFHKSLAYGSYDSMEKHLQNYFQCLHPYVFKCFINLKITEAIAHFL